MSGKQLLLTLIASLIIISNAFADDGWGTDLDFIDEGSKVTEISEPQKTSFLSEGYLRLNGSLKQIRENSKLNPDNTTLNIENQDMELETALTVSDYVSEDKSLRWLIKSYANLVNKIDATQNLKDMVRFDEIFVDYKMGNYFISIGKRRINWGHAMAFNPVNVIVPARDPMEPSNETQGQPTVWASVSTSIGSIDAILTRDYDAVWNSEVFRWGSRLNVDFGGLDLSGYYFDGQEKNDHSYNRMLGLSFSTNLLPGMTLYGEGASFYRNDRGYYDENGLKEINNDQYIQVVIGSYLIIDPESVFSFLSGDASLIMEVYYNGQGYDESERKNYYNTITPVPAMMPMISDYRFTGMNQLYYLATYRNSFWENYAFELSALVSQDDSFTIAPTIEMNFSDNYQLKIKGALYEGQDNSEFGNVPTNSSIELQLEVSF